MKLQAPNLKQAFLVTGATFPSLLTATFLPLSVGTQDVGIQLERRQFGASCDPLTCGASGYYQCNADFTACVDIPGKLDSVLDDIMGADPGSLGSGSGSGSGPKAGDCRVSWYVPCEGMGICCPPNSICIERNRFLDIPESKCVNDKGERVDKPEDVGSDGPTSEEPEEETGADSKSSGAAAGGKDGDGAKSDSAVGGNGDGAKSDAVGGDADDAKSGAVGGAGGTKVWRIGGGLVAGLVGGYVLA